MGRRNQAAQALTSQTRQMQSAQPSILNSSSITAVMADQERLEIIKANPIGKGLDTFRAAFGSACDSQKVPPILGSLSSLGYNGKANRIRRRPVLTLYRETRYCSRSHLSTPSCSSLASTPIKRQKQESFQ
jgi:hypothetical protein